MTINAHPLTWPIGWDRTPGHQRDDARFGKKRVQEGSSYRRHVELSVAEGVARVLEELQRLGIGRDDIVISTNVPLRLDGLPRSDVRNVADPGVSVWWRTKGTQPQVLAVDRYTRVADNLAAVAATLEAMRAIERHGGKLVRDKAFTGFNALPSPEQVKAAAWRAVLFPEGAPEVVTLDLAKARWRQLASDAHPDKHGNSSESNARMAELNEAYAAAMQELRT